MRDDAERIVAAARAWIGTPYRHQASTLGAGCDCLGLVRGVWRTVYGDEPVTMPPYRADMRDVASAGALLEAAETLLVRAEAMEAGRVVLFRLNGAAAPKHCGILVGEDRFVHAQEGLGVVEASLEGWARRVAGVFAFP
ncbi:NlpC/P60 family protein [Paradevosia shaoguanensis]|uniref:NlpC/P60 family protein n=1 Tax=Paradevosia shaoguanensis TaxID=1335043 RepID=UPI003C767EAF